MCFLNKRKSNYLKRNKLDCVNWLQRRDSNPRPSDYESAKLPLLHSAIEFKIIIQY